MMIISPYLVMNQIWRIYDIREFFQECNDKGTMNTRSTDEKYNALIGTLQKRVRILTEKIRPKVYEYGFMRE